MSQPNPAEQPFNRGHVLPLTPGSRPRYATYGPGYHATPAPAGTEPAPLLSFLPDWRPRRVPGRLSPEEQIQRMIDQREAELAELRALQQKYPLPPTPPAEPA